MTKPLAMWAMNSPLPAASNLQILGPRWGEIRRPITKVLRAAGYLGSRFFWTLGWILALLLYCATQGSRLW
jgi:hypothetical protein